jgi:regulator of sigma E protease
LEKLGYKVSTIDYSLMEAIPVGLTKGKDQLVGGKQLKMIFSPSGAYKQGGFKAIFDIFPSTWSWETF